MARTITPLSRRLLADFAVLDAYTPAPNLLDETFVTYEASGVLHARARCWSSATLTRREGTLRVLVTDAETANQQLCANCFASAVTAKIGPENEAYLALANATAEAGRYERLDPARITLESLHSASISLDITAAMLTQDAAQLQTGPAAAEYAVVEHRLATLAAELRANLISRRYESIPLLAAWTVTRAADEAAAELWRRRFERVADEPEVLIAIDRRSLELDEGGVAIDALALECWSYRQSPCGSLDLLRAPALLAHWFSEFATSPSSRFGEDPSFAVTIHDPAGVSDAELEIAMVLWDPFDPGAYPDFRSALIAARRL
jgi:hypothetical protein